MFKNLKYVKAPSRESDVFAILIPTWNNLEYLRLCVDSLQKNAAYNHRIIIMINEGSDGTLEWVRQSGLSYVHSPENIGICYGLNACRPLITTDYVLYANDDMYFLPGWDSALLDEVEKTGHDGFMFSATMIEPYDTGNPCVIVKDFGDSIANFREHELLDTFNKLPMNDWSGSTWPPNLMSLRMWDLVGGMSVEFSPGMYSDPDLSKKFWDAGVRLFKGLSASRVYHFGSKSTGRISQSDGGTTFLMKWGMTPGTFIKYYLRRGEPFEGPLSEPDIPSSVRIKNLLKKTLKGLSA